MEVGREIRYDRMRGGVRNMNGRMIIDWQITMVSELKLFGVGVSVVDNQARKEVR